jgi:flagellar biosynthesis protein FliR
LLLPVIELSLPPRPESEVILGCMVLAELADGLWFGWLTRIMAASLPYAGQIIADCAGLANVLLPSPELGSQTTVVARLYEVAVPTLILTSGLYKTLLSSLVGYYRLVPAGSLVLVFDNAATSVMMVAECFDLALRLAAPFILASVAWNVVLGLIVRLVPRLQIFFVALPGQIALGSILLAGVAAPMIRAWMEALRGAISLLPGAG